MTQPRHRRAGIRTSARARRRGRRHGLPGGGGFGEHTLAEAPRLAPSGAGRRPSPGYGTTASGRRLRRDRRHGRRRRRFAAPCPPSSSRGRSSGREPVGGRLRIATPGRRLEPVEDVPRLGERRRSPGRRSPARRSASPCIASARASQTVHPRTRKSGPPPGTTRRPPRSHRPASMPTHGSLPRWPRTRRRNRASDEIVGDGPTTAPLGRTPPRATESVPVRSRVACEGHGLRQGLHRSGEVARPERRAADEDAPHRFDEVFPAGACGDRPRLGGLGTRVHAPRRAASPPPGGLPRASPSAPNRSSARRHDAMRRAAAGSPDRSAARAPAAFPSAWTRAEWISRAERDDFRGAPVSASFGGRTAEAARASISSESASA